MSDTVKFREVSMRVAIFTDTLAPEVNGVANTLDKLSRYFERKSIKHAFFAPDYKKNGISGLDTLSEAKRVHRFPGVRVKISPESCIAFPRGPLINNLCDDFAPDLVHVTTEFGIGYKGLKYATSRKLPLIMSCHTDYCKYLKHFDLGSLETLAEKYLKWFYSFSDKTLAPSRHTLEKLKEKNYRNVGIWTRGIDTDKFSAGYRSRKVRKMLGAGDKFTFLYVGRLSPEKGLRLLIHAISEINNRFPDKAVFVFTGDGPYAEKIRKAGFDNVVMTGFKHGKELSEIYASCDCFAFPSGTETFGNTPLEAMASGLPVVGINGGGVTEFLTHGHNALLSGENKYSLVRETVVDLTYRVDQKAQPFFWRKPSDIQEGKLIAGTEHFSYLPAPVSGVELICVDAPGPYPYVSIVFFFKLFQSMP